LGVTTDLCLYEDQYNEHLVPVLTENCGTNWLISDAEILRGAGINHMKETYTIKLDASNVLGPKPFGTEISIFLSEGLKRCFVVGPELDCSNNRLIAVNIDIEK
jgi:hypothetical protein